MTMQAVDTLWHAGERWVVFGTTGGGLWWPPISIPWHRTSCYRGFTAAYQVLGSQLYLVALSLDGCGPVAPEGPLDPESEFEVLGRRVRIGAKPMLRLAGRQRIPLTGRILLGERNPMGWPSGAERLRFLELRFEVGRLTGAVDLGRDDGERPESWQRDDR